MLCELLIIAEGPDRGRISHVQPAPCEWGRKEGPPRFAVVAAELPAGLDLGQYRWDFDRRALVGPDGHLLRGGPTNRLRFPGEDDPPVRLPGKLAVVTCHFNPAGFARRREVFARFFAGVNRQGADLWVIEAARDCRWEIEPGYWLPGTGPEPHVVRINLADTLWQKERLLNLLIEQLPATYSMVAWLDADLLFDNDHWVSDTAAVLRRVPVAQLFERANWLDERDQPVPWDFPGAKSPLSLDRDSYARWRHLGNAFSWRRCHTGFAWAARRSVLEACGGLYDQHMLGSGDSVMAFAFSGQLESPYYGRLPRSMHEAARAWSERAAAATAGVVGFVPGVVRHLWHGSRQNRQYIARHSLLDEHGFDLARHITIGPEGLWEWTPDAPPHLKQAVSDYFVNRREDG